MLATKFAFYLHSCSWRTPPLFIFNTLILIKQTHTGRGATGRKRDTVLERESAEPTGLPVP